MLGDPSQSIEQRVQWPTWTRQPWISTESRSGRDEQAGSQQPQVASEEDLAEPADMDTLAPSGTATEAAEGSQTRLAVTPNPLQRQFTEWLLKHKKANARFSSLAAEWVQTLLASGLLLHQPALP